MDENGLTVVNFSVSTQTAVIDLASGELKFTKSFNPTSMYYVNDLYADTTRLFSGSELSDFTVTLPPYGSALYVISTEEEHVELPLFPPVLTVESRGDEIPGEFVLFQNYPNPFNPSTTIRFDIPKSSHVTLEIYNTLGRKIRTLVNETKPVGEYTIQWDGKDDAGVETATGVYIMRMVAVSPLTSSGHSFVKSVKLVKLK